MTGFTLKNVRANTNFARKVKLLAQNEVRPMVEKLADEMVKETVKLIDERLGKTYPPHPNRPHGQHGVKLRDSFGSIVTENGAGGWMVLIRSEHPAAGALEGGSPRHWINAKNYIAPFGPYKFKPVLMIPLNQWPELQISRNHPLVYRGQRYDAVMLRSVSHPGNKPYRFIKDGMEAALKRARSGELFGQRLSRPGAIGAVKMKIR